MSRQARHSRKKSSESADIGTLPAIRNKGRRQACRTDLHLFLREYFPHSTGLTPFSHDHVRAISRIQLAICVGGLFLDMFPRGFAKTTISENSCLFALLYGWRRFVPIIGNTADAGMAMIDSIKLELSENDLLYDDFPEICHPIRHLEGKPQRCQSQHYKGNLTHIEWTADKIALPIIKGRGEGGGGVVVAKGMTGALRGLKHKSPTGEQIRPDFSIVDDPQTDESAGSPLQIEKRLDILRKTILKLGSHLKKSACVVNATVIEPGDMVDQLSDPRRFPNWQTERIKMVKKWPDKHETLWLEEYAKLRNTYDPADPNDQQRAHRVATAFYERNREAMDAGGEMTWEECYDRETEISATQHAYNLLIDEGPDVFASECQNEPLNIHAETGGLTPQKILVKERLNQLDLGVVPITTTRLIGHVDVQGHVLYWSLIGFEDDFSQAVVDFGTWPNVRQGYFFMRDIKESLRKITGADDDGAAIRIAVQRCVEQLRGRRWQRADGTQLHVERIGVDARWGRHTDDVFAACRESPHAEILVPTFGQYFGAKSKRRLEDMKKRPGDRAGTGWRLVKAAAGAKRGIPYLLIDTNRWKTAVEKRLLATPGSTGSVMLNGKLVGGQFPDRLRMLADHYCAEEGVEVRTNDTVATEWRMRQPDLDNHLWDNLVSSNAIASMQGVREQTEAPPKKRKRVSFAEQQRMRRERSPG